MPEGPEILLSAKLLNNLTPCVVRIERHTEQNRYNFPKAFTLQKIRTNGKCMLWETDRGLLEVHFGLTGYVMIGNGLADDGDKICVENAHKKLQTLNAKPKVTMYFDSTKVAIYDSRGFGYCKKVTSEPSTFNVIKWVVTDGSYSELEKVIAKYPNRRLINVITNQKVMSGIGNYLRSEIFHVANMGDMYLAKTKEVDVHAIVVAIKSVISEVIMAGGTTKYILPNGKRGNYAFKVYGKKDAIKVSLGGQTYYY